MRRENKQELVIPMEGEHTAMVLSCVKVAAVEKRKEAAERAAVPSCRSSGHVLVLDRLIGPADQPRRPKPYHANKLLHKILSFSAADTGCGPAAEAKLPRL